MHNNFTVFKVGKQFPQGSPNIPFLISLSQSPLICVHTFPNVTDDEVERFSTGPAEFSFCKVRKEIISFLMRIKGFSEWSDCHYAPCADIFDSTSQHVETEIGNHTPVALILVDQVSGIIKALRITTVTHPFMLRLNVALKDIKVQDLCVNDYLSISEKIISQYSTEDLLKQAGYVELGKHNRK